MEDYPIYPPVKPARINEAEHAIDSFRKIQETALAIPMERVGRVTTDVPLAASIALGAVYNLEQLRSAFETELNDDGAAGRALDRLKDCALGALYADMQSMALLTENELSALLDEARPIRQNLLGSAESLANFGVFPSGTVADIREGLGNVDAAKDLIALAALFNSNWERVTGKVPFDRDLVDQASFFGTRLLRALGAKEVGDARLDTSMDWHGIRARTFRLLVDTYEVLRRATAYVRWYHGDGTVFTPSLHARQSPSKKGRDNTEADDNPEQPMPHSDQVDARRAEAAETQGAATVEPGMRGAPPFVQ